MITRLLRRFCSAEVKMLLKHLEEHPEDFRSRNFSSNRTSRWELLASQVDSKGTFIEQRVLSDVKRRAFKRADRQRLLGEIVAQTVAPETVSQEEIEDGIMYTGIGPTQLAAQQQHIQIHKLCQQQMALNAAQGINYGTSQQLQGLSGITGITSTHTGTTP